MKSFARVAGAISAPLSATNAARSMRR